jgi:hypothetical protein
MRRCLLLQIAVIGSLSIGLTIAADVQLGTVSVRQHVLNAVEQSDRALADTCTKSFPALAPDFDSAIASRLSRLPSIAQSLLATEQFKSLSEAEAPQELVVASATNADMVRNSSSKFTLDVCTKILGEIRSTTDEQLHGMIFMMLFYTKAMIDMKMQRNAK